MALIGLFEIFLGVICFFVFSWFRNRDGMPRSFPVVGMLPELVLNVHRLHEWGTVVLENSGCTFLLKGPWFTNMDFLVTVDPANIHHIMSSNFQNFPKGTEFKKIFDLLGDGIFNSDSDFWKNQRRAAQAVMKNLGFNRFSLKTSFGKVEKGLIPILEHVSKEGLVLDLQDLFQRFTFDTTCKLVTGYDPGCLSVEFPEVQFSRALDAALEGIFYRHLKPQSLWQLQRWLGIGGEKKMKKACETLDRILAKYVSLKRAEMSKETALKDDGEGVDLLTCLMNEDKAMGLKSDDKFLRDTIMNFMLAGRDTTSSALTWFFWLLSQNPKVEARIREELKSKVPGTKNCWRLFDPEEVNRLVYLHGALCEALRLYPPVAFQHKVPLKPDILPSGHHVNPNMKVLFALYAMGRMKCIWGEDCLEFKPERWISEQGRIKHEPSYKFLSFNAGPRTCLGKDVAFTQMKTVAAAVIHNYNVQVVEGHPVEFSVSIMLQMKHGLMVKVSRRWN